MNQTHQTGTQGLPDAEAVGTVGTWTLPTTVDDAVTDQAVTGRFLGLSTSRHPAGRHTHPGPYAGRGVRCSACRWSEFRVFSTTQAGGVGGYVVHTTGRSAVPGEVDGYRPQARVMRTAPEVVETLTTRRRPAPGPEVAPVVYLSPSASRVLAQASAFDAAIRDAYENRRVA